MIVSTDSVQTKHIEKDPLQGWRWARLGDVCDIAIGKTPSRNTPRYWDGTLPWVAIADLRSDTITTTAERITEAGARESGIRLVRAGTLLFSFKLTIGKMAFAGCDLYTNEAIAALTPLDDQELRSEYLRFVLQFTDCAAGASHAVKGRTLNQAGLEVIRIPLPNGTVQRRIVSLLQRQMSLVETARVAATERMSAASALGSAYLREVFDNLQTNGSCRLRDVVIPHIDIIHPGNGRSGTIPFVGLEHIESNTGRRIGNAVLDLAHLSGRKPAFRKGQIIYGYLRPYLNKVWLAEFDGCCSVDQFAFDVRSDIADPTFVAWFMRSPTFLRRAAIVTTTGQLPRIGTEQIAAVEIGLPPLDQQREIAATIDSWFANRQILWEVLQAEMDAISAIPNTLLRQVFAGAL